MPARLRNIGLVDFKCFCILNGIFEIQKPPGKPEKIANIRGFEAWAQRIYHTRVNHDTHVGEANVLLNWMGSQPPQAEFPKVLRKQWL